MQNLIMNLKNPSPLLTFNFLVVRSCHSEQSFTENLLFVVKQRDESIF